MRPSCQVQREVLLLPWRVLRGFLGFAEPAGLSSGASSSLSMFTFRKPILKAVRMDERIKNKRACKECSICNEPFDTKRHCPRLLPCSHCLCSFCISEVMWTSKACPFCRADFQDKTPNDFPKNRNLMEILQYVSMLETMVTLPNRGGKNAMSFTRWREDFRRDVKRESLPKSENAKAKIEENMRFNSRLMEGMRTQNDKIANEAMPKLRAIQEKNTTRVEYLALENIKLKGQLDVILQKEKDMKDADDGLEAAKNFTEAAPFLDLFEDTDKELQDLEEDVNDFLSRDKGVSHSISEVFHKTEGKINAFLVVIGFLEREPDIDLSPGKVFVTMQHGPQYLTVDDLRTMERPVRRRVLQGRIFTVDKSMQRRALVSLTDDDRFCLQYVTEGSLPPNSFVVSHEDIMEAVDTSEPSSFLEIGAEGKPLGRLFIRFSPSNKAASTFPLFCTGDKECSFLDASVTEVLNKGDSDEERVLFKVTTWKDWPGLNALQSEGQEVPELPSGAGLVEAVESEGDGLHFIIRTGETSSACSSVSITGCGSILPIQVDKCPPDAAEVTCD
ncbi:uncharacterized protein [Macrobrachium rosenbergii]|uniref:uncharacterized protein isoform X2 n=1 Tax=Macrobrachium rosenbergii TaxID=79674 RepID=UPI0034D6389E